MTDVHSQYCTDIIPNNDAAATSIAGKSVSQSSMSVMLTQSWCVTLGKLERQVALSGARLLGTIGACHVVISRQRLPCISILRNWNRNIDQIARKGWRVA